MALIKCSECGKEISDKAASCPNCGCPVSVASENSSSLVQPNQKKEKRPKAPKSKKTKILIGVLCAVIVIFAIFFIRSNFSRYDWNDVKLSSLLPEPESKWGNLSSNREDYLSLSVHRLTNEDYIEYISACVDMGFSIDAEQEDNSYSAYNEDGYVLDLYYTASDKTLRINIDAPMEMGTIEWSDSEIAKLLPIPNSTEGKIERDDEQGFEVYLKNISKADLDAYISECKELGFTQNYEKEDDSYYAQNADGYQFTAEYDGCNVVFLSIIEPQKTLELQFVSTNSKCDVEVRIDDSYECTVDHGESETRTVKLGLGKHTIRVENDDNDEIYDYYEINVTEDDYIKFEVRCTKDSIQIGLFGDLKDNQEPANNENPTEAQKDTDTKETEPSVDEEPSTKDTEQTENEDSSYVYDDAIVMCQLLKDALYNPDSLQIHKVLHIELYGTDYYYLDYSAMNKMGGYTRNEYYAKFENSVILYMVNEDDTAYPYTVEYDIMVETFEEYPHETLDVDLIEPYLD